MLGLNLQRARDATVSALSRLLPFYGSLVDDNNKLRGERDRFRAQRDSLEEQKATLVEERGLFTAQRDSLEAQKGKLIEERDRLQAQRDSLAEQKGQLIKERDLWRAQRNSLEQQKGRLVEARDLLQTERDSLAQQKGTLVEERDQVRAQRDSLEQQKAALIDERDLLQAQRDSLSERLAALVEERENIYHNPGHFYSPIPDLKEVLARRETVFGLNGEVKGVDLRESGQLTLLADLRDWAAEFPYTNESPTGSYYRNDNPAFSNIDAVTLFAVLRFLRPRNLIEVGSGFSSALIYDTNQNFLDNTVNCAFVEPYPDTLKTIFGVDWESLTLHERKVQEIPVDFFLRLQSNDVLFIDSSHVCKVGSDVDYLFKEVIPSLRPGVILHVHDIFFPFEYPEAWVCEGRAWNEGYVLRSFLQYNADFEILFWPSWMIHRHRDKWLAAMPGDVHTRQGELPPTGSIWLRRRLADKERST